MLEKRKRVRLIGKKLSDLNKAIHERDNYECIICGNYVSLEEKFHHEPCGSQKEDVISKGVTICYNCHQGRHFGNVDKIRRKCQEYLDGIYFASV